MQNKKLAPEKTAPIISRIQYIVELVEYLHPGLLQTFISGNRCSGFSLNSLSLLRTKEFQYILHHFQILSLGSGSIA